MFRRPSFDGLRTNGDAVAQLECLNAMPESHGMQTLESKPF